LTRLLVLAIVPMLVIGAVVLGIFAYVGAGIPWDFVVVAVGSTGVVGGAVAVADWLAERP